MDADFHSGSGRDDSRIIEMSSGGGNVIADSQSNDLVKMQSKSHATGDSEQLRPMQDL